MHFYKAVYTSNNHESSVAANSDLRLTFSENITPLENEDKLSCDGKVTQAECLKALDDFKNEKSPGTDGLPAEFYKYFWTELHPDMIRSFNFAYDNGSLSISQRTGIITLIPKPNKDTTLLDNLRPISLLNTLQNFNQSYRKKVRKSFTESNKPGSNWICKKPVYR